MLTFDGLSHGSWVTNWLLFLAEKIIKRIGSVVERYPSTVQSCVSAPQPLSSAPSAAPREGRLFLWTEPCHLRVLHNV